MIIDKTKVDYTLYLVTDSGLLSRFSASFISHIASLIHGGVSVVQLREKELSTKEFIARAKEILELTRRANIPLLINDRIDVALAIDADGVHVGQDDMDAKTVRKLIGKDKIIGVSVNTLEQAKQAHADGADYIGIGAVFNTSTKQLTVPLTGIKGVRKIVEFASSRTPPLRTVAIGGLNGTNIARVKYQSSSLDGKAYLDGIAVVSALMSARDPKDAAKELLRIWNSEPAFVKEQELIKGLATDVLKTEIARILSAVHEHCPLTHHMTNDVVKNFNANVTLAIGGSPIMSTSPAEVGPLALLGSPHSLVLNIGTLTPSLLEVYQSALYHYNNSGTPIVLDPVGAGATAFRTSTIAECLENGYVDVLKGNEGEISAIAGVNGDLMRGVDSLGNGTLEDKGKLARGVALRERNIVVVTGKEDVISDGVRTVVIRNGHALLGKITGSGCSLGSVIASCLAVAPFEKFLAVLSALLLYNIAAERTAAKGEVKGPGTFIPAFIDELASLSQGVEAWKWVEESKVAEILVR